MKIPLFRPVIRETAIDAVGEVLRSGWLGLGSKTAAFEQSFANYIGAPYCVGLNSCTAALHLGLRLLNLSPGTEVITTPLTFVATNHVILYESCRPVFADIQPHSGNLEVNSVAERITDRTGAMILVHYGGYPCDLDAFYKLSREREIPIIEDCAHACGAIYKGKRIGSHGDIHAFSFHAGKNLPMGDGGALTVRSSSYDARLRKLRCFGIDVDTYQRCGREGYQWDYNVTELGFKYHMTDIDAAIGLEQLSCLDDDNARRATIAGQYRQALANVPGIRMLQQKDDRASSHHLFCILAEKRDALMEKLQLAGVSAAVHYRRNDEFPMFEKHDLPNAERFWRSVISLPMHLQLTDEHIQHIVNTIKRGW